MPIRPSSGQEIRQLVDALAGEDVVREAAIARLAVLGERAADHLLRAYAEAKGARTRLGILRALEAGGDPRAVRLARDVLTSSRDASLVDEALGVLRGFLEAPQPDAARDALDALVAAALDTTLSSATRLGAFDALRDLPAETADPIRQRLANDSDPAVRIGAGGREGSGSGTAWAQAIAGELPSPSQLKTLVAEHAAGARLTELQRLIDTIRSEETREAQAPRRDEWRLVRGALHQALAARGSRLALYDLRDSLLAPERLPVGFLAALEEVGDVSCLESLAAAYDASSRSGDPWWRDHVAGAFRAIVHREGLTRRHGAIKRLMARWPAAAAELMGRV
jgi:hypothetical protein